MSELGTITREPCWTRPSTKALARHCVHAITVRIPEVEGQPRKRSPYLQQVADWIEDTDNGCRGLFLFSRQGNRGNEWELLIMSEDSAVQEMRFECAATAMMVKMRFG